MKSTQVSMTFTINGEKRTLDLHDCDVMLERGSREVIPDTPGSFRVFEATDDLSVTIIGKSS